MMLIRHLKSLAMASLLLTTNPGCASMSRFAYTCGDWLSPGQATAACGPTTGPNSSSCQNGQISGNPCDPALGPSSTGYSASPGNAPAGNGGVTPVSYSAAEGPLESNVRDLQQQTAKLRGDIMDVKRHLTLSQSELIETRAANELNRKQLDRMQAEIGQWGQQLATLQSQLQARDDERLRQMQQMDRVMQQVLSQYDTTNVSVP